MLLSTWQMFQPIKENWQHLIGLESFRCFQVSRTEETLLSGLFGAAEMMADLLECSHICTQGLWSSAEVTTKFLGLITIFFLPLPIVPQNGVAMGRAESIPLRSWTPLNYCQVKKTLMTSSQLLHQQKQQVTNSQHAIINSDRFRITLYKCICLNSSLIKNKKIIFNQILDEMSSQ